MEVEQIMKCLLAEMKTMQQDRCQPSKDDASQEWMIAMMDTWPAEIEAW
jgi:hypothetical protein